MSPTPTPSGPSRCTRYTTCRIEYLEAKRCAEVRGSLNVLFFVVASCFINLMFHRLQK